MGLDHVRNEIERLRRSVRAQRREIQSLARAGISTRSADELLERMLIRIDELCAERDRLVGKWRTRTGGSSAARP
jgi:transposase-like protein